MSSCVNLEGKPIYTHDELYVFCIISKWPESLEIVVRRDAIFFALCTERNIHEAEINYLFLRF